jgi:hypothetical protein
MKGKPVSKSIKDSKKSVSVLHQLNNHLQSYLEALKSASETNEYQQLSRFNR